MKTVLYNGKLGTAMIPKVLSNMLCAVQVLAMSECFAIGKYILTWMDGVFL